MSKLLAMMMKPKNYMYATIKGTLTENNGVFSGFSSSNYLELQQNIDLSKDIDYVIKYSFGNNETNYANIFLGIFGNQNLQIRPNTSGTTIALSYNGSTYNWTNINVANYTYFRFQKVGNVAKMYLGNSKNVWDISYTINNSTWVDVNIKTHIGQTSSSNTTSTFIVDLNQSYIKINNTKYQLQAVPEE